MKIQLHVLCYNESQLVPYFLNHYLPICDSIIVYDNMSTDNCCELLSLSNKIEIIKFDTNNCIDNFKYLEIKNNEWKKYKDEYDWMIVCDFDEFLYHPNLMEKLEEFKNKRINIASIVGFSMKTNTHPNNNENIIHTIQYGKPDKNFSKNIIFNPKQIDDINYDLGSHVCNPITTKEYNLIYSDEPLFILHYKKLGYAYEYNKYKDLSFKKYIDSKTNNLNYYINMLNDLERKYDIVNNPLKKENINVIDLVQNNINKSMNYNDFYDMYLKILNYELY